MNMKTLTILLFSAILFSCQNESLQNASKKDSSDSNKTIPDSKNSDTSSQQTHKFILPPDTEEAETLVARYYSTRNQEMKYPFYKGLGLKILDIKKISVTDSFLVYANVKGRKWFNPNKDTLTIPFEENIRIRAYKNGTLWQADSIGNK
jgi:hypothetical protein